MEDVSRQRQLAVRGGAQRRQQVGAIDRRFDIGVIFSTDSDLRPAIEFVMERFSDRPRAEAAAWNGAGATRRLSVGGPRRLWSHMLDYEDYLSVHDPTDYNRP